MTSRYNRGEKIKQRLKQLLTLGQNKQSSTEQVRTEVRWLEDFVKMSHNNECVSHKYVLKDDSMWLMYQNLKHSFLGYNEPVGDLKCKMSQFGKFLWSSLAWY